MTETAAVASHRLTSQRLAEAVGLARGHREAARRSRATAESQLVRAERNRQTSIACGAAAIRLRWSARVAHFDRHGEVVAVAPDAPGPAEQPTTAPVKGAITLDGLVSQLFEAGLAVTACRALVNDHVAPRLDAVVEMLDSVIRDLRQAVFDGSAERSDCRASGHDRVVAALRATSRAIEGLWQLAHDEEHEAAVALGEASQSLHRALVVLDGAESSL